MPIRILLLTLSVLLVACADDDAFPEAHMSWTLNGTEIEAINPVVATSRRVLEDDDGNRVEVSSCSMFGQVENNDIGRHQLNIVMTCYDSLGTVPFAGEANVACTALVTYARRGTIPGSQDLSSFSFEQSGSVSTETFDDTVFRGSFSGELEGIGGLLQLRQGQFQFPR